MLLTKVTMSHITSSELTLITENLYPLTYIAPFRRRQWHPTSVLLPGKSHRRRSLVGCSPWGHWESDTTERVHFHALEKEMATHSSVLAWRIPGTGEPGGLPSMGSQSRTQLKRLSSSSSSSWLYIGFSFTNKS